MGVPVPERKYSHCQFLQVGMGLPKPKTYDFSVTVCPAKSWKWVWVNPNPRKRETAILAGNSKFPEARFGDKETNGTPGQRKLVVCPGNIRC